jgi:hypothetical protein
MLALVLALTAAAPASLSFADLFEPGPTLKPSQRALSLNGKRVRIDGFMAHMEIPPHGAFWLCRMPVAADEAGGGTADLPPESVLVELTPARADPVEPIAGPLRVEGRFEVGRKATADGTLSLFRIVLDPPRRSSRAVPKKKEAQ